MNLEPSFAQQRPPPAWHPLREDELTAPDPALRCGPIHGDVPIRKIIDRAMAHVFAVAEADLYKPSRGKARVALARQVAMYVAHVACGLSFTEIGQLFERDRTTVAHACGVIEDRREDPVFDRALDLLGWVVPAMLAPERRIRMVRRVVEVCA